jgi:hypothetical protein
MSGGMRFLSQPRKCYSGCSAPNQTFQAAYGANNVLSSTGAVLVLSDVCTRRRLPGKSKQRTYALGDKLSDDERNHQAPKPKSPVPELRK